MGQYEDIVISAVGWTVHLIFMLSYLIILSAPLWIAVWLIADKVKRSRRKARRR